MKLPIWLLVWFRVAFFILVIAGVFIYRALSENLWLTGVILAVTWLIVLAGTLFLFRRMYR